MKNTDGLAQTEKIPLKDCLEQRVLECTQDPKCRQRRISVCVWDGMDEQAEKFCKQISKSGSVDCFRLHTETDVTDQFLTKLKGYKLNIANREVECPNGIYFLFVYEESQFYQKIQYDKIICQLKSIFSAFTIEYCRLTKEEVLKTVLQKETVQNVRNIASFEWTVGREDIQIAKLLLQNAKHEEKLFSNAVKEDFTNTGCAAIKSTECNAVREDFCRRYLKNVRMETSKNEGKEAESKLLELLYPEKYKSKLKQEIPNPTWLPMVGAESLTDVICEDLKTHSILEKLLCKLKKESLESEYTVKEMMDILFGGNGYSTRTERLRKKIKNEIMQKLCDEIVLNSKEDIKETILKGFSMYDIIYVLQKMVLSFREKSEGMAVKSEELIEEVLENKFYYTDVDVVNVYQGFQEYLKCYDNFTKHWLEYCWWNAVARYLQGLKEEVESEFEALYKAEIVLKNSCIPFLEEKLSFVKEYGADERVLTEKELRNRIQTAVSNAEFNNTDIAKLIKAMDKYYISLNEKNVQVHRHPKIYLFISEEATFCEEDLKRMTEKKECSFQWRLIKSKSLSEKNTLQVRVYDLSKER